MAILDNVSVTFDAVHGAVHAVKDVSLALPDGSRNSLLGESGCGKSVLALALLNLLPNNAHVTGTVSIDGMDVTDKEQAKGLRGKTVSLCWSNAERFFNPVIPVGRQIVEAYTTHNPGKTHEGRERTMDMLERLGFDDPAEIFRSYPFQLSGGMNQRAMIAMSVINKPSLLVVDEPTRGLDDSSRERVIAALEHLDEVTLLLITHDVTCARRLTETAYIMKDGSIIDEGPAEQILSDPIHPYTRKLVKACLHDKGPDTIIKPGVKHD